MKITSSAFVAVAALGHLAQAQSPSSIGFLQAARAAVDIMGQDMGRIASGGLGPADAIAAAHDIVYQLNNQTADFDAATKALPAGPSALTCADIITAFEQYTFQFDGESAPLAAISQSPAMKTPGTGTDGTDNNIGQDVFKVVGRLQGEAGATPRSAVQGNGFVQALNRVCSSPQQQADTTSHATPLAAAYAADLTAYTS